MSLYEKRECACCEEVACWWPKAAGRTLYATVRPRCSACRAYCARGGPCQGRELAERLARRVEPAELNAQ